MDPTSAISPTTGSSWLALNRPELDPAHALRDVPPLVPISPSSPEGPAPTSFGQIFQRMVEEVNSKQIAAQDTVRGMLGGENVSLHQAVIAMEEAGVAFQLMVEVRNRLLESYQELMRMQL